MGKILAVCCFLILICFVSISISQNTVIVIDDYKSGLNDKWESKVFEGKTKYSVTTEDSKLCIMAESNATASALIYKIKYDPKEYPILSWEWKVKNIIKKGNALKKEGDDYAARVYVIFPSILFWKTKAINYIWANRLPEGEAVPNAFTSNAKMIAVQSGEKNAGKWIAEERNVFEDYKKLFGEEPPMAGGIAIMTDTDNTGESATAWYGPVKILMKHEKQ
jgi:hypothetical protein